MKMLVRLMAVACVLGGVAWAQGAGKRPMTFADLQAMKRVSDPQISPSGKWVLFSVTDVSLEKNSKTNHLWVTPIAGGTQWQVSDGTGETNGRISPDGKWVLYSSSKSGTGQIWLAPWDDLTGTLGPSHQVTALETEADGAIWAPDSKHFLFVSSVYPECESHGAQRNEDEVRCNAEKDGAAAKSPVKAMIFDHLLYRHWNAYVGSKHSHIFYGSTERDAKRQPLAPTDLTPASVIGDHEAPTFSLGGPPGYAISPDGKEVAYVTNLDKVPAASTNNDIFVLQVGAEPSTAKKVSTSPGSDDGPAYSPDGKWLAWRSQARNGFESDKFALVVMDRSSGAIKDLMPKFENWVDEFTWAPDSKDIYFASGKDGMEPVFSIDLKTGSPKELPHSVAEYGSLQASGDGKHLVASAMRVTHPSEIVDLMREYRADDRPKAAIDVKYGAKLTSPLTPFVAGFDVPEEYDAEVDFGIEMLTRVNDALLTQLSVGRLEPFWFVGAAGTKVEGFIVRPPNFDPAKKYPVKFLMHGGPQTAWGDAWSYRWNWELMAASGYVVVGVNRRGSTGYGQKFVDEVSGDWGGKAFVDLMKGLDYAEAHYSFIDKDRECALGASYGGFMANWVLTHTDRFKCIVTHDGMYNPQSAYGTTEELWFNEWEFRPMAPAGAKADPSASLRDDNKKSGSGSKGDGDEVEQTKPAQPWDYFGATNDADPFRKWSPMLHIKAAHTPTLVVHSQRDYRLDVSEGFQMFTALQRLGVPSRMLYFPDEGHWVLKPQNSQLWYETVDDWCDRWLGMGKYAGQGTVNRKQPTVKTKGQ